MALVPERFFWGAIIVVLFYAFFFHKVVLLMLDDIIGNEPLKDNIKVAIKASRFRHEPIGHILLSGSGGLGKTHVLNVICQEIDAFKVITQGNRLGSPSAVKEFIIDGCRRASEAGKQAFLIVDEIHEVPIKCQEEFYYPIDNKCVLSLSGDHIYLSPFTLAGATTCPEELDEKSLMSRFVYRWHLRDMEAIDLLFIVNNYLRSSGCYADVPIMAMIATRSRGIPRLALKYARRAMDYANSESREELKELDVNKTFEEMGIDDMGLDPQQRKYLTILYNAGKPVGVEALASMLDETKTGQVKKMIEPYLWSKGLITTSSRGRELTEVGFKHIMAVGGFSGEV